MNEARPITVGVSQEVGEINVALQLVRTARIAGRVTNPDGTPTTAGNVNLMPDGATGRGGQIGANYGGRIQWDGAFTIASVPPGRYLLRARGEDTETPQFAALPVSVNGSDMDDVVVVLSAGATITGTVTFLPGAAQTPDITNIRIGAPVHRSGQLRSAAECARRRRTARLRCRACRSGPHLIRPSGNMRGWSLKSVAVNGRDVTDTPIDLRAGQTLSNVAIVFTDAVTEINGTITNAQGAPVPDTRCSRSRPTRRSGVPRHGKS